MNAFEIFGIAMLVLGAIGCLIGAVVNHRRSASYEEYLRNYKQYRDEVRRQSRSRL